MTEAEKIERRAKMAERKAQREAVRAEREEQERQDKVLVLDALRAILKDANATSAERIFALCAIDEMQYYHFVPYALKHFQEPEIDKEKVLAYFAEKLEAAECK